MGTTRNVVTLVGMSAFAGVMFVVPYIFTRRMGLQNKQTALTGTQIQRGPYVNSGSRDAGPDPDWVDGQYQGKR